jgi:microcompartment protein CcmL/EutN
MVEAADAMVKAARVELVSYEKTGGGYTTAVIRGDVAAVKAACEAGQTAGARVGDVVAVHIIARPHASVDMVIPLGRGAEPAKKSTVKLAKVLGTVVATQKDAKLRGLRFLMLGVYGPDNEPAGGSVVAVDGVGAGVGEMVLFASGSSARQTIATDAKPVDAVVMAIVDSWEVDGEEKYRKGEDDG